MEDSDGRKWVEEVLYNWTWVCSMKCRHYSYIAANNSDNQLFLLTIQYGTNNLQSVQWNLQQTPLDHSSFRTFGLDNRPGLIYDYGFPASRPSILTVPFESPNMQSQTAELLTHKILSHTSSGFCFASSNQEWALADNKVWREDYLCALNWKDLEQFDTIIEPDLQERKKKPECLDGEQDMMFFICQKRYCEIEKEHKF